MKERNWNIAESIKSVVGVSGVYMIREEDRPRYIGMSENIGNRIRVHKTLGMYRESDILLYIPVTDKTEMAAIEAGEIYKHRPEYNKITNVSKNVSMSLSRDKASKIIRVDDIKLVFRACKSDPRSSGARDAAIIACIFPGGLLGFEVAGLDLGDYDPETGALTVRHGKRNKARITYLANGATRAMADWLAIRGSEPGALFCAINKGGNLQFRHMTKQAVYNAVTKRSLIVGGFSPNDLLLTLRTPRPIDL